MVDVVVARYNEDVSWTKDLRAGRVLVYDKSGEGGPFALPNVGREAHTFAKHVYENYEALAEHTVFLQGNPFDHCSKECVKDAVSSCPEEFLPIGKIMECDESGSPHHPGLNLNVAASLIGIPAAENFRFCAGAQFVAPKHLLIARERSEWCRLVDLLELNTVNAWQMERLWPAFLKAA
jgi:hypothetical protein